MFVKVIPNNRGKKDGCYCSLVESRRINGVPRHVTLMSFGFVPTDRIPYLKAAFNRGDPAEILTKALCNQENLSETTR